MGATIAKQSFVLRDTAVFNNSSVEETAVDLAKLNIVMLDKSMKREFQNFVTAKGKDAYLQYYRALEALRVTTLKEFCECQPFDEISMERIQLPKYDCSAVEDFEVRFHIKQALFPLETSKKLGKVTFDYWCTQLDLSQDTILLEILIAFRDFTSTSICETLFAMIDGKNSSNENFQV